MDTTKETFLFIVSSMIILLFFTLIVLVVFFNYRKRKIQHQLEVNKIKQKFKEDLLQMQLEVQTRTMMQIGREIHDNIGQRLTLAALYTQQLSPDDNVGKTKIEGIFSAINDALIDLRSLSKSLQYPNEYQNSLSDLLENECRRANAIGMCKVMFSSPASKSLVSLEVKQFVVRIFQEFLQNSLRHSKCKTISVELSDHQTYFLKLQAKDDGEGYNQEIVKKTTTGIGLKNMTNRAKLINARLTMDSAPSKGTSMSLIIPKHS